MRASLSAVNRRLSQRRGESSRAQSDEEGKVAPPFRSKSLDGMGRSSQRGHWDPALDEPPPVPTVLPRRRGGSSAPRTWMEDVFGPWVCCAEEEPMTLPDIPQGPLWGPLVRHMPCRDDADVHVFVQLLDGLVGPGNVANDVCERGNSILHYCAQRNDFMLLLALSDLPNTNLDHERYVDLLRKKNFMGQRPLDLGLLVDAHECVQIIQSKHRLMGFHPDPATAVAPLAPQPPPPARDAPSERG